MSAHLTSRFDQEAAVAERYAPALAPRLPPRPVTVHRPRTRATLRIGAPRTHFALAGHFGLNYVKKYYMDTYLGLLWLPLIPVLDILTRSLVFGGFLGVSSGGRPYLLFLLIGSIGWYFFDRTALWSYRALQFNRKYFRTLPIPWLPAVTGAVVPGILQALLYSLIALVVSAYYRLADGSFYVSFSGDTLYGALGLVLLLLYAWTLGLLLAPLVRTIRDIRLILRYLFAFWYMITPILYDLQSIPERYQAIAIYNPLTAPIELVRHGLLQMEYPESRSIVTSLVVLGVLVPVALVLFVRAEHAAHARL